MTTVAELEANMKEMSLNNNKLQQQQRDAGVMTPPQPPMPMQAQLQQIRQPAIHMQQQLLASQQQNLQMPPLLNQHQFQVLLLVFQH